MLEGGLLLAGEFLVGVIAHLGEFFGLGQKFVGVLGEELLQGSKADLTLEEVLELAPVGFLAVEAERVLTLLLESRVEAIEMPVTAINGELLFLLAQTHTCFKTMVDTGSVSDDQ